MYNSVTFYKVPEQHGHVHLVGLYLEAHFGSAILNLISSVHHPVIEYTFETKYLRVYLLFLVIYIIIKNKIVLNIWIFDSHKPFWEKTMHDAIRIFITFMYLFCKRHLFDLKISFIDKYPLRKSAKICVKNHRK